MMGISSNPQNAPPPFNFFLFFFPYLCIFSKNATSNLSNSQDLYWSIELDDISCTLVACPATISMFPQYVPP